jgi:predicted dehydrogenase
MRKVPIAIVGLNLGQKILREHIIRGPGSRFFQLAGVCCMEAEVARRVADEFAVKAYDNLEQVLRDGKVMAVGLFSGPAGRAELVSQCVRAGKHVMTAMPFELDPDRALTAFRDARAFKRVIHLNSPSPVPGDDLEKIQEWRQEFNLGQPIGCRAEAWANCPEPPGGGGDGQQRPESPIFRLGICLINDLVRLFGAARKVSVLSSRAASGRSTVDNAQLSIEFHRGGLASVYASFCIADGEGWKNSMAINFERGTIYRNVGPLPEDHIAGQGQLALVTLRDGKRIIRRASTKRISGEYQWDAFYRAIQGEKLEREITAAHVAEGVRIIAAMGRAEESGRVQAL